MQLIETSYLIERDKFESKFVLAERDKFFDLYKKNVDYKPFLVKLEEKIKLIDNNLNKNSITVMQILSEIIKMNSEKISKLIFVYDNTIIILNDLNINQMSSNAMLLNIHEYADFLIRFNYKLGECKIIIDLKNFKYFLNFLNYCKKIKVMENLRNEIINEETVIKAYSKFNSIINNYQSQCNEFLDKSFSNRMDPIKLYCNEYNFIRTIISKDLYDFYKENIELVNLIKENYPQYCI